MTGVTQAEVTEAAESIQAEGGHPTIERIRLLLGTGSNTTIAKYLKEWRDGRSVSKSSITNPPDQVQAAVTAVWEKLHQETQASIEAVKADAKEQVEAVKEEAKVAHAALASLTIEYETLQTQHHALAAQKELLVLDYKQAQDQLQLLRERLDGLERRHQEVKSQHEQQLTRLDEKYLADIKRLTSHAEQEVQLAQQLVDTLKSHYEEARVDRMRQIDQLKVENQKQHDVIKRLETDSAGLKQALEAKVIMYQQVTTQLADAQRLITAQQAQWETLQDKQFVTDGIVAAFDALPGQVASELRRLLAGKVTEVIDQAVQSMEIKLKEVDHA